MFFAQKKGGQYMAWWWRTKPRSMMKVIEWLPMFLSLEGQNWNKAEPGIRCVAKNKPVHLVRREYVYQTKKDLIEYQYFNKNEFMNGQHDKEEKESDARNDKSTYEFFGFGYVDEYGIVRSTPAGEIIKKNDFNSDILLKQMLKIQFPSPLIKVKKWENGTKIFPMEVLLHLLNEFGELNRLELGFSFFCDDMSKLERTKEAIREFRKEYNDLPKKTDPKVIKALFSEVQQTYFPEIKNKLNTYYNDYGDGFIRTLVYTGFFSQRGRGFYTKLYINEHSKLKMKLLLENYKFIYNPEQDLDTYMEYFGNPHNVTLPWEVDETRKIVIERKIEILRYKLIEAKRNLPEFELDEYEWIYDIDLSILNATDELNKLEHELTAILTNLNETLFVKYYSKTKEERTNIIEKFEDILDGNEDQAALWLECNTWKSIVAMNGTHDAKRNFSIEEDLTPRFFAKGTNNTPDMEVYQPDEFILIPEVSLMSGAQQWEHEGSSVIDHVLKFINKHEGLPVHGIFLAEKMYNRTQWQFFLLNRESWVKKDVVIPVIPLTIRQYIGIISHIYEHELSITDFNVLIEQLHNASKTVSYYEEWYDQFDDIIHSWKENVLV